VQRYFCVRCGKSYRESQPLDGLRVSFEDACKIVHLLCEGMGIRAIERLTGHEKKTVLRILESAGETCARVMDEKVRNVRAANVAVDEVYGFVLKKLMNGVPLDDPQRGEFFTYLSVDMASKLIINTQTSKRNNEMTEVFLRDLKNRMADRFQLTTDGYWGYCKKDGAVSRVFGNEIDYATEKKIFSVVGLGHITGLKVQTIHRRPRIGCPEMSLATTCHAERTNLSLRLFNRRFTRKTLGYSKKLDNLRHAMAIFTAHFNFCRIHSAHGRTPAQAAGLTDHTWTIEELIA
jgi:hypothetical protein